jgi:hypothetical protein
MAKKTFSGSIALTAMKFVKMRGKGQNGPVDGIFIPIEANKLVVGKEKDGVTPVYMPIRFQYNSEADTYGQNGFVAKSVSSDEYKAADTDAKKEALKEFQPILGNLKEFTSDGTANDAAGAASTETYTPDDDLPF